MKTPGLLVHVQVMILVIKKTKCTPKSVVWLQESTPYHVMTPTRMDGMEVSLPFKEKNTAKTLPKAMNKNRILISYLQVAIFMIKN